MNKLLFISLLSLSALSLEEFAQDPDKGVGKQNRLIQIESYLTSFSKEYNSTVDKKMKDFEKRIATVEKMKSNSNFEEKLAALRAELTALHKDLDTRHTEDMIEIRKEIKKAVKDEGTKREALAKGLMTRIIALEKIVSGFGKIKSL